MDGLPEGRKKVRLVYIWIMSDSVEPNRVWHYFFVFIFYKLFIVGMNLWIVNLENANIFSQGGDVIMSDFSEKCRALLKENGYTVYHLSEVAGLDRTALQRTITGKRLPGPEFLSRLCSFLNLSEEEKDEIFLLYRTEKVGTDIIRQRECVKNIIEKTGACYQFSENKKIFSAMPEMIREENIPPVFYTDNPLEIQQLMLYVVFREIEECIQPVMYTNLPILYGQYFEQLFYLCLTGERKIKIHHMMEMNKNISDVHQRMYNLEVLEKIMPVVFNLWDYYFPKYYYAAIASRDERKTLYPFYVITTQYVLQISYDYQSVILHQQTDYAAILKNQFSAVFGKCMPIMIENGSPIETYEKYVALINEYGCPTHGVEYEPCYVMLDPECGMHPFIEEYKELGQMYKTQFALDSGEISQLKYKLCFSEKGLSEFAREGNLQGYISRLTRTFSMEERKVMLENLYVSIEQCDMVRLIADERFKVLSNISIELFGRNCAIFFNIIDDRSFSVVIIKERLICSALYDFFESMEENNLVLTKEETLNRVMAARRSLER